MLHSSDVRKHQFVVQLCLSLLFPSSQSVSMRIVVTDQNERAPLSECVESGSQVNVGHGRGSLQGGACRPGRGALPFTGRRVG